MKTLVYVVAIVLIGGCSAQNDATSDQAFDVKNEARKALLAYGEAINSGDIDLAASYYDRDPDFHWIERGGVQYESGDAAAASLQGLIVPGSSANIRFDNVKVADLAADAAFVSAHFTYEMSYGGDQPGFSFDGWMSVAMVKRVEGWRIAAGQVGPGPDTKPSSD